jgi:hypothetical protein
MKRLVLCRNDYPWKLVPKTVTEKQAGDVAKRLTGKDEDPENQRGPRIYYHVKEVDTPSEKDFLNLSRQ